jgi:hypothetical protein
MTMQNKRNRHGREGHNVTGEPQDSIHLGVGERIRLEDVPLDSETGERQVGNRFYNDARYLLKNKNSNWRLISAQILIDSPTAGRVNASWYSTTGLLRTLTNSPLTFAGATSAGNLRWDLVELFDNGTAAVKTGDQGAIPVRPTPTSNTLIAGEFIWDENGNAIPVETVGSFSNDRYSTRVSPNTTGLYAKIWEGELSYVNNYGIFITYHEPTNTVNNDGTGVGLLNASWTCDVSKNIVPNTVKLVTYPGSVDGEFRLVQLAGNRAAIYHKSNHYWGRIQFRIVFQNSAVRTEDFVNLGPYGSAPTGVGSWDSEVLESGEGIGASTVNQVFTYTSSNVFALTFPDPIIAYVALNGQVLRQGGSFDYTVSGNTLNVSTPLLTGDEINVLYFSSAPLIALTNVNSSEVVPGRFGNGDYIFPKNLTIEGQVNSLIHHKGNSGTGTVTFNWDDSNIQSVTLTGNCTFAFSNPLSGASYQIIITQDGTGGRTITWPTIHWQGKSVPSLTGTANSKDIVTLTYDGANYNGVISKNHGV